MKKATALLVVALALLSASCRTTLQRKMKIEEASHGARALITINTIQRSYFDPDGFSRLYEPRVKIRVFGEGKGMAYRNSPGTRFTFGEDFDVNINYCSGGYLWISQDEAALRVALSYVDETAGIQPLEAFNGKYRIRKAEAELLLKRKQVSNTPAEDTR
jgi:hypothetical protein